MIEEQPPLPDIPPPDTPFPVLAAEQEPERFPFWGYADLFLLAALAMPCMFLGWAMVRLVLWICHLHAAAQAAESVAQMLFGYTLLFTVMMVIFRVQYDRPFWLSVGWTKSRLPFLWNVICGLGTALLVALIAGLIRTPPTSGPIVEMMQDRPALILLALFGTTEIGRASCRERV